MENTCLALIRLLGFSVGVAIFIYEPPSFILGLIMLVLGFYLVHIDGNNA